MIRVFRRLLIAFAAIPILVGGATAGSCPQTVGLFLNTPDAHPGYTLFTMRNYPATYLIDMNGELIHSWQHVYESRNSVYLLENGQLLRCSRTTNPVFPNIGSGGRIELWDWDSTLLWEYVYSNNLVCGHHDVKPMPNGNILVVAWEYKSPAEALAAGRNPALLGNALWPDHIVEIQPVGTNGANIVWEWHAWDHLIQDFDPTKANYGVVADHPELINLNAANNANPDWLHFNAVAYDETLDQIVVSPNFVSEIWVIDHSTTTKESAGHTGGARGMGGDLLYRWGNPQIYGRGAAADQRLFSSHSVHWIAPGLPGAGNLLLFNNGNNRWPDGDDYSSVEEIVTSADVNGDYPVPPAGQPHQPPNAEWVYTADPPESFFSAMFGGAQRMPNGNTLVIESNEGRIVELDPSDEIVWEYIIPVNGGGPVYQCWDPTGNAAFRAPRYEADYAGLAGHDLTPQGPIELDPTAVVDSGPEPGRFLLAQNHPNPFRPATTIEFWLAEAAPVSLRVYGVTGQRVATLLDARLGRGAHRASWDADGLPSGVYYYTLRAGSQEETRKMVLVR